MPYKSVDELPDRVKKHLSGHQQEIFRAAWNNAHKEYGDEESAFKVAWAAAKNASKKKVKESGYINPLDK